MPVGNPTGMWASSPGNLAEDLDADAHDHDRAQNGQGNRQNSGDRVKRIAGNRGECRGKRSDNRVSSALNSVLLS